MSDNHISEDSKSSFDRFRDDLTELILNYLWIEDKFRFECLSKRIQSLIFSKQSKLIITNEYNLKEEPNIEIRNIIVVNESTNVKQIENVLKKLKSLTDMDIRLDELLYPTLGSMADNCQHLTSLTIFDDSSISDETINYFGQRCGDKVKELLVFGQTSDDMVTRLSQWMPNLETVSASSMSSVLTNYRQWNNMKSCGQTSPKLPKLKTATFKYIDHELDVEQFAEEYPSVATNLNLLIPVHLFPGVSFEQLIRYQRLSVNLCYHPNNKLANNCLHLQTLKMEIHTIKKDVGLLPVIGQLLQLERLELTIISKSSEEHIYGSVADLKSITGLKHLSLHIDINDQTLVNIDKHLPRLQSLSLRISKRIIKSTLESITRLEGLTSVTIGTPEEADSVKQIIITDSDVIILLKSQRLKRIIIIDRYNANISPIEITVKSIKSFAKKAKLNPKINYYFTVKFISMYKQNYVFKRFNVPTNLYLSNNIP